MTAYRFCRTDDRALLVDAHERCRGPEDAGEPALDRERFQRLVRELDLWCSSSMVAMEGDRPVGVLLGAKRDAATLVLALRVHPDHRRRGHGRHLLTSLGQKLAILGPPRLVAEVPAERPAARALFEACRWRCEERLVDWRRPPAATAVVEPAGDDSPIGPIGLEEAAASGLLHGGRSWHRNRESLGKLVEVEGLGFYSTERLEAFVFHRDAGAAREIVALGVADGPLGRPALHALLVELDRRTAGVPFELGRVAPDEVAPGLLEELGFAPVSERWLFATEARAA